MKLLFICDPIKDLNSSKDTSVFLIEKGWARNFECSTCEPKDVILKNVNNKNLVYVRTLLLKPPKEKNTGIWYEVVKEEILNISTFDFVLIRKDPPFDVNYNNLTLLLDFAEKEGVKILNSPKAIRNNNEKLSIFNFPAYIAQTVISANKNDLIDFSKSFSSVVFKPLNEMGGKNVFITKNSDINISNIVDNLTNMGVTKIVAQEFIPEITKGDKRILIINGKPVKNSLTRIPREGSLIANLAAGGTAQVETLSKREKEIANDVGKSLASDGLFLIGIDIIGDKLTEINITSPTGFREISKFSQLNIEDLFFSELIKL